MKGPSLQRTATLSATLHLTAFLLTLLVLRQSNNIIIPSPYIVSLVASPNNRQETSATEIAQPAPEIKNTSLLEEKESLKVEKLKKADLERLKNSIDKLKAIESLKHKKTLREIVLRKSVVTQNIRKSENQGQNAENRMFDIYQGKITNEIRKEWVYPEIGENNLMAIISVKIMRDGTIKVQGIEKSSGNALFDRSVQRAIAKATPVTPPPYEMEIGIRFYP